MCVHAHAHEHTNTYTHARMHTHTHTHVYTHTPQHKYASNREAIKLHLLGIPWGYQLTHFRLFQWNMSLHVQVVTLETTNYMWRLNKFTRWCIIPDELCLQNDFINNTYMKMAAGHMMLITWSNSPGTDMAGIKQWFVLRLLLVGIASWGGEQNEVCATKTTDLWVSGQCLVTAMTLSVTILVKI